MGRPLKPLEEHKGRSVHLSLNRDLYMKLRDVSGIMSKEIGITLQLTQTLGILIKEWEDSREYGEDKDEI
jgi:hypothetical protein